MVQRRAALGDIFKVSLLVQDVIRRRINTNDMTPQKVRDRVLDAGGLKYFVYSNSCSSMHCKIKLIYVFSDTITFGVCVSIPHIPRRSEIVTTKVIGDDHQPV